MKVSDCVTCIKFPCADVRHECYAAPSVEIQPEKVSIIMIAKLRPRILMTTTTPKGIRCFSRPRCRLSRTRAPTFPR